jgi:transposase
MIKMAQLEDIRKMYFMEGLSIREIHRRTGIHRDTISKYLSLEEPQPPKYKLTKERKHPVLDPYIPMIEQILEDDKKSHRKQRHTGTKIFETLRKEGFPGGYNTVMDYLRNEHRKQKETFTATMEC